MATVLMFVACTIWAQTIAIFCAVLTTFNPELAAFHETMVRAIGGYWRLRPRSSFDLASTGGPRLAHVTTVAIVPPLPLLVLATCQHQPLCPQIAHRPS